MCERYGMPKEWFTNRAEYDFEGKRFYSSRDYDVVLKYIYGDYMTPPPVDQQVSNHSQDFHYYVNLDERLDIPEIKWRKSHDII